MIDIIIQGVSGMLIANGLTISIALSLFGFFVLLIFSGKDYRIGFMAFLMYSMVNFIFCFLVGFDWTFALLCIILAILLMSFAIPYSRNEDVGFVR